MRDNGATLLGKSGKSVFFFVLGRLSENGTHGVFSVLLVNGNRDIFLSMAPDLAFFFPFSLPPRVRYKL